MSDYPTPPSHAPATDDRPDSPERRRFLTQMSLGLAGVIGALVSLPVVGYLLTPLIRPPQPQWIDLGTIDRFGVGTTSIAAFTDLSPLPWAGLTARTAVYVWRPDEEDFHVFAVNCTHLGCPVSWLETAHLFVCPCHGGAFYRNGTVAAGPPPRPLSEYLIRVADGHLFVQTRPLTTTARPLDE